MIYRYLLLVGIVITSYAQEEDDAMVMRKMKIAQELVNKAVEHIVRPEMTIARACHDFVHDNQWRRGEIAVFIFGENGECYLTHPYTKIWKDFYNEKDKFSESFIKNMLEVPEAGGWVVYPWNNDSHNAFVRVIQKRGKKFIIGAGFYPESSKYRVIQLVEMATRYLTKHGSKDLFKDINNPFGNFVRGDVYLWAYDMDGNVMAHGQNIAMVGQNQIDWQDSNGKYRNREMIKLAQAEGKGWIEYMDKGMRKLAYIKTVNDPATNKTYIIGGGYYPDLNDDTVKTFVKRAVSHLKRSGKKVALADFSNQVGDFVPGPLRLFVYSPDGTMLADSQNPEFVGQNLRNAKDAEGKYITRRILEQAQANGKAWISFLDKDAYKDVYVEKISVPDGDFIIGAGYWPASKERSTKSLVDKAYTHFMNHSVEETMSAFTSGDSDFLRGDLSVFVFDDQNYCLAYGQDLSKVWMQAPDIIRVIDTKGEPVFETVKETARAGGGWVEFSYNNAQRRVYVKEIEKEYPVAPADVKAEKEVQVIKNKDVVRAKEPGQLGVQKYIIGSGYYL